MLRRDLLKGKMAEHGMSGIDMAKAIGITPPTFYAKLRKGIFDTEEVSKMVEILKIDNLVEIFFAKICSSDEDSEL